MAEHSAVNRRVVGSSPTSGATLYRRITNVGELSPTSCGELYGYRCPAFPNVQRRLDAIHLRHLDIHQNKIKAVVIESLQSFTAICGDNDAVPSFFEQTNGEFLIHFILQRAEA